MHSTATGIGIPEVARWRSSWSEVASAQWMSSSTSSSGDAAADRATQVDDSVEHPQPGARPRPGVGDLALQQGTSKGSTSEPSLSARTTPSQGHSAGA